VQDLLQVVQLKLRNGDYLVPVIERYSVPHLVIFQEVNEVLERLEAWGFGSTFQLLFQLLVPLVEPLHLLFIGIQQIFQVCDLLHLIVGLLLELNQTVMHLRLLVELELLFADELIQSLYLIVIVTLNVLNFLVQSFDGHVLLVDHLVYHGAGHGLWLQQCLLRLLRNRHLKILA
jgi:hypothetical protein